MNTVILPFAPGIKWQVTNQNVIIPKLDTNSFNIVFSNNDIVVVSYGGLFESFFSLNIFEYINKLYPAKNLYWCGNEKFKDLIYLNGLGKYQNIISKEELLNFPSPIFLDKENNTYFNHLNNYISRYSINNIPINKDATKKSILKQLIENTCLELNNYEINFRNLYPDETFIKLKQKKIFNIDKPFVLFLPNRLDISMHETSMLGWNIYEIKSFISILNGLNIPVITLKSSNSKLYGVNIIEVEPKINLILELIEKCQFILSDELDYLFISLLYSKNAKTACRENKTKQNNYTLYGLTEASEFANTKKDIYQESELKPFEVVKWIKTYL